MSDDNVKPIRTAEAQMQIDRVRGVPAGRLSPDAIVTAPGNETGWRLASFGSGGLAIYDADNRRVCLIKRREDGDRIVAAINSDSQDAEILRLRDALTAIDQCAIEASDGECRDEQTRYWVLQAKMRSLAKRALLGAPTRG